jgi:hypothetical protein
VSVPQPVSLTYNAFTTQLGLLAVEPVQTVGGIVQGVSASFNTLIPQAINVAELRIQRDAQLLPLQTSNGYSLTSGNNILSIPVSDFVTVQTVGVNVDGEVVPLTPVSKEWLQNVFPGMGTQGPPGYFAMIGGDQATAGLTSTNIMLGPVPDSNYPATIFGMIRMPSLNQLSDNSTDASTKYTWISEWLPDLLIAAAMVHVTGFQRDFGAMGQVDEGGMGVSWEAVYQGLLKGVQTEEALKRFEGSAWSAMKPPVTATPNRQP